MASPAAHDEVVDTLHWGQRLAGLMQVDVMQAVSYLREDREGGLDAVGAGFPAIPQNDLMVFSSDDWTANKDRLIYEAWAAKTLKVEGSSAKQ